MTQEIVKFNVGGKRYETTLTTLKNVPDNMLLKMVEFPGEKKDRIFIDRNGHLFSHILDYLRDPEGFTPPENNKVELSREAAFYCLFQLVKLLETKKEEPPKKEANKEGFPSTVTIVHSILNDMSKITAYPFSFTCEGLYIFDNWRYGTSMNDMNENVNIMLKARYELLAMTSHVELNIKYYVYIFSLI